MQSFEALKKRAIKSIGHQYVNVHSIMIIADADNDDNAFSHVTMPSSTVASSFENAESTNTKNRYAKQRNER